MADFPTLANAVISKVGYSEKYLNPGDIVSEMDAGYKLSRKKFTRKPLKFTVPYIGIDSSDKATLEAFIEDNGTTGNFYWVQPLTSTIFDVRLSAIPAFDRDDMYWSATFEMEQV